MQVDTVVRGKCVATAADRPVQPSATAIRMSPAGMARGEPERRSLACCSSGASPDLRNALIRLTQDQDRAWLSRRAPSVEPQQLRAGARGRHPRQRFLQHAIVGNAADNWTMRAGERAIIYLDDRLIRRLRRVC